MYMKRNGPSATLFDPPQPAFELRVRRFAREVAKRHRSGSADVGALVTALRAYHRMWSLVEPVPPLDATAIGIAVSEYGRMRQASRRRVA